MIEPFIAGLFGFFGILLGALLQFWLSRRTELEAKYMELKLGAYVDYVNSIARVAFVSSSERPKALDQVAAAKTRICIFGDKEVVETAAQFEQTSKNLANTDAQHAFTDMCQVMRKRGVASGSVADAAIHTLLFGYERKAPQTDNSANPNGD